jgi:hypothetical protein
MKRSDTPFTVSRILALLAAAALALATVQPAAAQSDDPLRNQAHDRDPDEDRIAIGAQTVGVMQSLQQENNPESLSDLTTSFQSAAGNLTFEAALSQGIDVYFELYISSPNHEGDVFDREGYLYVDRLPEELSPGLIETVFDYVDLKAGHMELNYGDVHWYRSDVGQVQRNPLVGNYVVDPNTIGIGTELYGEFGPVYLMAGLNNGATTGDFQDGRGFVYYGKAGAKLLDGNVRTSASLYRVDHSENGPGYPVGGTSSNLFSGNFSGSRYQAVLGGGGSAGQVFLGGGQDVTAFQYDARARLNRFMLMGMVGYFKDADVNGAANASTPSEQWTYYGATAQYYLVPERLYVAAQYSGASVGEVDRTGEDGAVTSTVSDGLVQRIQAGVGGWILKDQMLLKAEYVTQSASDFQPGTLSFGGVDAATEPEFSGFMVEIGVSF